MDDQNEAATTIANNDEYLETSEKITLQECQASAGLEIIVLKGTWKLGKLAFQDETAYFESLLIAILYCFSLKCTGYSPAKLR